MISVIICSVKPFQVSRLEKNIAETIGNVEYEVIAFDNRNTHYGLCEIYNLCAEKSRYDNLCFAHEDIQFDTIGWGEKIISKLSETDCGVIGFAGTTARISALCGIGLSRAHWRSNFIQHMNKGGMKSCFKNPDRVEFSPVVSVDGMCLFVSRKVWQKVRFDEKTFPNFHLYDLDFTTAVFRAGYINYICNTVIVEHFSEGYYTQEWLAATIDFSNKWRDALPLYVPGFPCIKNLDRYVRSREFRFIKAMMKSRGKCSWELIDGLCRQYYRKYPFYRSIVVWFHAYRYRKRWKREGRL